MIEKWCWTSNSIYCPLRARDWEKGIKKKQKKKRVESLHVSDLRKQSKFLLFLHGSRWPRYVCWMKRNPQTCATIRRKVFHERGMKFFPPRICFTNGNLFLLTYFPHPDISSWWLRTLGNYESRQRINAQTSDILNNLFICINVFIVWKKSCFRKKILWKFLGAYHFHKGFSSAYPNKDKTDAPGDNRSGRDESNKRIFSSELKTSNKNT